MSFEPSTLNQAKLFLFIFRAEITTEKSEESKDLHEYNPFEEASNNNESNTDEENDKKETPATEIESPALKEDINTDLHNDVKVRLLLHLFQFNFLKIIFFM